MTVFSQIVRAFGILHFEAQAMDYKYTAKDVTPQVPFKES
jgi:hypothetical protein